MVKRTYLFNRSTNKKYRLNGIQPSVEMPAKQTLRKVFSNFIFYQNNELPPKVDLRQHMTEIEDQSEIASCIANALTGAYEYLLKKKTGENVDVSRLFIYYTARTKRKNLPKMADIGCTMTNAIEALEEYGVCLESDWPYDVSKVNSRPNDDAFEKAKEHRITEAFRVNIDLNEMKSCLAQGYPFAFGLRLYKSFDKATSAGVVPMPSAEELSRKDHGGHAMLAVGYSDHSKCFIVRNSWGNTWGDQGYCYIPYDYLANKTFCFEPWTIHKYEKDDFGRDCWFSDDSVNLCVNSTVKKEDDHCEIHNIDENDTDDASYDEESLKTPGKKRTSIFSRLLRRFQTLMKYCRF